VNKELVQRSKLCNDNILEGTAICLGYILIGFTEPLAIVAYVLRAFRLRRIFDAQTYYFREERKPTEMIESLREGRIIKILAFSVASTVAAYLTTALCLMFVPPTGATKLYLLPTIDTGAFTEGAIDISQQEAQKNFNQGMTISLYFLICYSLIEGLTFLVAMHSVRNFNEDFNLFDEMKKYASCWLVFTNLILFVYVQGSYSGFLSLMQINRYKTCLYTLRSLAAVAICAIPPLVETYKDASFFPIPPSRDSIESVDMVLHIPIAIDFFYDYLKNRHNPDGIHAFALYIDLRLYDGLCLEATSNVEDVVEMAQKIKEEYLDPKGEYYVELEPSLR